MTKSTLIATTPSSTHRAIRSVTVFCAASHTTNSHFSAAAADLGRAIGQAGWTLVYGGNYVGLMGILADAAREAGARVVGITPQFFIDKNLGDQRCDQLIVSANMRDRKSILEQHGDAFVAIPGGIGTLDELFDTLVSRSLGLHDKPIVLLNINRFYDSLLAMIDHGIEHQFIKPRVRDFLYVATSVEQAVQYLTDNDYRDAM